MILEALVSMRAEIGNLTWGCYIKKILGAYICEKPIKFEKTNPPYPKTPHHLENLLVSSTLWF